MHSSRKRPIRFNKKDNRVADNAGNIAKNRGRKDRGRERECGNHIIRRSPRGGKKIIKPSTSRSGRARGTNMEDKERMQTKTLAAEDLLSYESRNNQGATEIRQATGAVRGNPRVYGDVSLG
jgi:hypothetical protein